MGDFVVFCVLSISFILPPTHLSQLDMDVLIRNQLIYSVISGILISAVYLLRVFEQLSLFIYLLSFQLPGKKYAPGYNADVGDKHIWLK